MCCAKNLLVPCVTLLDPSIKTIPDNGSHRHWVCGWGGVGEYAMASVGISLDKLRQTLGGGMTERGAVIARDRYLVRFKNLKIPIIEGETRWKVRQN